MVLSIFYGSEAGQVVEREQPVEAQFRTLHKFLNVDSSGPMGPLVIKDDFVYGIMSFGETQLGSVYSFNINNESFETFYNFTGKDLGVPRTGLFKGVDGYVYCISSNGSNRFEWYFLKLDTAAHTVNSSVTKAGLSGPPYWLTPIRESFWTGSSPTQAAPFITTGTIFLYNQLEDTVKVVWKDFPQEFSKNTFSQMIVGPKGKIFGNLPGGPFFADGFIYTLDDKGNHSVFFNFTKQGFPGINPNNIILGSDNALYGTAISSDFDLVYKIIPSNKKFILIPLNQTEVGSNPCCLIQANNGLLYGMTSSGGENGIGSIFAVDPKNNTVEAIYYFNSDYSRHPTALLQIDNETLLGTSSGRPGFNEGSIFEIDLG